MGRFRHFRSNPTVSDPIAGSRITFSVLEARKFLILASCLSEREQRNKINEIEEAQRIVGKADRRNKRRKLRRRGISSADCDDIDARVDSICGTVSRRPRDLGLKCLTQLKKRKEACNDNGGSRRIAERSRRALRGRLAPQQRFIEDDGEEEQAIVAHYEETIGPEGETIRFKLHYTREGEFSKRTRTRNEPQVGDIVLDLVSGVKAWRITTNRRRKHPVTPAMRKSYESSCVYKVRKLAAGKYASSNSENLSRFLADIKNAEGQRLKKKKNKKMKKRKNRKK